MKSTTKGMEIMPAFEFCSKQVVTASTAAYILGCSESHLRRTISRKETELAGECWTLNRDQITALQSKGTKCRFAPSLARLRVITESGLVILAQFIRSDAAQRIRDGVRHEYFKRKAQFTGVAPAPALPAPSPQNDLPALPVAEHPIISALIARIDGLQQQVNILSLQSGTRIPRGHMPYSELSRNSGLSDMICRRIVQAYGVPVEMGMVVAPTGIGVPTQCPNRNAFVRALYQVMEGAVQSKGGRWSHPLLGSNFVARDWPRERKF